jgi:hypothetical protein
MRYDQATDAVQFDEAIDGTTKSVRSYERENGKDKVVMHVPSRTGDASFNSFKTLERNFDHLVAVDTGTKKIGGSWVSATVAYGVPGRVSSFRGEVPFYFLNAYVWARSDNEGDEEAHGWNLVLERDINPMHFSSGRTLGVVVDSRLGELQAINERRIPYFRDQYLPAYATLIFATDSAADGLPNQMIRLCDDVSTRTLKEIERGQVILPQSAYVNPVQVAPSEDTLTVRGTHTRTKPPPSIFRPSF